MSNLVTSPLAFSLPYTCTQEGWTSAGGSPRSPNSISAPSAAARSANRSDTSRRFYHPVRLAARLRAHRRGNIARCLPKGLQSGWASRASVLTSSMVSLLEFPLTFWASVEKEARALLHAPRCI